MTQRIILIHGRSTKPAKEQHANLLRQSLLQGLNRVDPEKAEKVALGGVAVDYVYYGDINNKILAEHSQEVRDELTDKDPAFENARCLPITGYPEAIDALSRFKRFNKRAYDVVLAENDSKTWRDNLARFGSTISALATATLLNEIVIRYATADLGDYLMRRTIGSQVRERLQEKLKPALTSNEDVCLVAHSMGTIVAYPCGQSACNAWSPGRVFQPRLRAIR